MAGRHNEGGGIKSLTYPIREVRIKNEITNELPIRKKNYNFSKKGFDKLPLYGYYSRKEGGIVV